MALKIGDRVEVQTEVMEYPETITIELIVDDTFIGWSHSRFSYITFNKRHILNYLGSI